MTEGAARNLSVGVLIAACLAAFAAPDGGVVLVVGACLAILVFALWMEDDVPIFLLPVCYQWAQVATKPIQTVLTGVPLNSLAENGATLEPAVFISSACLAAFAVGLRGGLRSMTRENRSALLHAVNGWSVSTALSVCLGLLAIGYVAGIGAAVIGPLRQPLLAIASIRMVGLFLLVFWSITTGKGRTVAGGVVFVEIASGLTGFFADFRGIFIIVFLAVVAARPNFKPESVVLATAVAAVTMLVAVFWSSMKGEYRDWVSGGEGQVVVRPLSERIDYITNEVLAFDSRQFTKGLDALVSRLSYVDFIAATMMRVPEIIPHQDGRQLAEAFYHVVTPRALFPDKPPVPDDSAVTEYYTGIPILGDSTSISIGYVGELYIDFGFVGSILAAGLLGVGVGWSARKIALHPGNSAIVTYAALIVIALPLNIFETALIKLVGASVTAILAAWLLAWWGRGAQVQRLLRQGKRARPPVGTGA